MGSSVAIILNRVQAGSTMPERNQVLQQRLVRRAGCQTGDAAPCNATPAPALVGLQRSIGNHAVQRLVSSLVRASPASADQSRGTPLPDLTLPEFVGVDRLASAASNDSPLPAPALV